MFAKYHYLDNTHNNAAKVFICTVNNTVAGFLSLIHFPHGSIKNFKRIHRLVILPDFQGIGIGKRFLDFIANQTVLQNQRCIITTSNTALVFSLKKDACWNLRRLGRVGAIGATSKISALQNTNSGANRITTSWEYTNKTKATAFAPLAIERIT